MLKGLTKEYYPMRMVLENYNATLTSELIKSKLLQEFGKIKTVRSKIRTMRKIIIITISISKKSRTISLLNQLIALMKIEKDPIIGVMKTN
jgi:hypothetical protein